MNRPRPFRQSDRVDYRRIGAALRDGEVVDDRIFDDVYPSAIRRASALHWTPVEMAIRAARLVAKEPGARILDIGAGVAKFCIVAAATVDAVVMGIEHRPHLVEIGREAAAKIGVRVELTHGTLGFVDPLLIDGIYLFSPFAENLCDRSDRLDATVELSAARYRHDIEETESFLREARPGTRLVTFCSWGGVTPDDYRLAARVPGSALLDLWIKTPEYSRRASPE